MRSRTFLSLIILLISISTGYSQNIWSNNVQHCGALRNAMVEGDITAKIQLSELEGLENLYALGAIGNLDGEIQIFNSQPFNTFLEDNNLIIDNSFQKSASLLVYAQVKTWIEIAIPAEIKTRDQFQEYLEEEAERNGIDTELPFPFQLHGVFQENDWHVIQWDPNDAVHTHEKHRESGLFGKMENVNLTMLGFFSKEHAGIFTHHTTFMHVHYITEDRSSAGHTDDFILGDNMILSLPTE